MCDVDGMAVFFKPATQHPRELPIVLDHQNTQARDYTSGDAINPLTQAEIFMYDHLPIHERLMESRLS
jgi:hypothetical protein